MQPVTKNLSYCVLCSELRRSERAFRPKKCFGVLAPSFKAVAGFCQQKSFFLNFIFNSFKFDAHQNFDIFKANFIYTLLKSFRQQKGSGKSCKHFTFVNYDAGVTLAQKLPLHYLRSEGIYQIGHL